MTPKLPQAGGRGIRGTALAITLVVVLLVPRIGLAWAGFTHPEDGLLTDSWGYLELAGNLRELGRFQATPHEEGLRTPVYPVFLATVQTVFGEHLGFVVAVQLCLSLVTVWFVWRLAWELGGSKAALGAAWLYALNPNANADAWCRLRRAP